MLPLDRELAQLAFRRCLASRARSKKVKRNTDGHSIVLGIGGKAKAASEYHKTSAAQRVSEMFDFPVARVRNFSIIAHIDHGKSTLADRLLELTGTIPMKQGGNKQVMDNLQVEQERGITVKAQTASVIYTGCTGEKFLLNLIDTPGHVDFGYEVSCSLAACDGTLLVVDASQGVQAQTLANFFLAFERGLHIIPVINKIDLPHAQVERVMAEMVSCFDVSEEEIIKVSAKSGHGCEAVLSAVIDRIPPPNANQSEPFKGLIFDSWYDGYRGIINLVEVMSGELRRGDKLVVASTGRQYDAIEVGVLHPKQMPTKGLGAGQMGYIVTGMKDSAETRVGDTLFDADHAHGLQPFPGFKPARSMVWAGLYPIDQSEHDALVAGLDRLCLNDSSVSVRRQTSPALGPGFRLGFLGMLHMDVFRQRLEQEHSIETIFTTPSVSYRCRERDGTERTIECPSEFPTNHGHVLLEPMVIGTLVFPEQFTGRIIQLCQERRGEQKDMSFISSNRVMYCLNSVRMLSYFLACAFMKSLLHELHRF